ncbi:MAG: hypothetical protein AAF362_21005 [Pseudomonadota bacterium]
MSILARLSALTVTAAAVLAIGVQAGLAQPTQEQRSAIRSACPADYEKLCSSIPPGGLASLKCLEDNVDKLESADCKSAVEAVMGGSKPAGDQSKATTPPASDATAKAKTTEPAASASGSSSASAASTEKTAAAAPPPAKAVPAAPEENTAKSRPMTLRQDFALVRHSCGPDFRKLCGNVILGGGRAVGCLRAHEAMLSQHCKTALMEVRTN